MHVHGTSSPSRSLCEPVHLSAFLFASFPNAYESNAIFDDIESYSVLDFPPTKPPLNREQESEMCNTSTILKVSGKLNLLMNLNRVPLIVLGFFNFNFPIDFIGGQLTGFLCFVETHRQTTLSRSGFSRSAFSRSVFSGVFEVCGLRFQGLCFQDTPTFILFF